MSFSIHKSTEHKNLEMNVMLFEHKSWNKRYVSSKKNYSPNATCKQSNDTSKM